MTTLRHLLTISVVIAAFNAAIAEDDLEPTRPDIDPAVTTSAPAAPFVRGDRLDLESSSIRGNQELPKVLYIVPWKDPSLGELVGKPVNSLVDEVIAPVDREVFLRQTKYFDQLYTEQSADSDK